MMKKLSTALSGSCQVKGDNQVAGATNLIVLRIQ